MSVWLQQTLWQEVIIFEAANELSTKIGNLIAEFCATHLHERLNTTGTRRLTSSRHLVSLAIRSPCVGSGVLQNKPTSFPGRVL